MHKLHKMHKIHKIHKCTTCKKYMKCTKYEKIQKLHKLHKLHKMNKIRRIHKRSARNVKPCTLIQCRSQRGAWPYIHIYTYCCSFECAWVLKLGCAQSLYVYTCMLDCWLHTWTPQATSFGRPPSACMDRTVHVLSGSSYIWTVCLYIYICMPLWYVCLRLLSDSFYM